MQGSGSGSAAICKFSFDAFMATVAECNVGAKEVFGTI
jgi:hypothetical protein